MKKLIISSVLAVAVAGSTAFGQGYVNFGGGSRTVWNATGASPLTDSGFAAAFLWSSSSSTSPMGAASVATNNSAAYSATAAWTAIEGASSSGWNVATTGGTTITALPTSSNGSFSYNSGVAVPVDNAGAAGATDNLYVIAWETQGGLYTTLAAAEAGNATVGWSSVFSYVLGAAPPATPPAVTGEAHFGIGPVPEPTTLALAGLGGLSMLFLRRKKA